MSPSKAERSLRTKKRLEQVARRLFATRGFADVSAAELVSKAGVTRGALYHHYNGKEGLFEAVVEGVMRELHAKLVSETTGMRDPLRALGQGIDVFLEAAIEPGIQHILLVDGPSVLGWARWREMDARYGLGLVKQSLSAAMAAGQLSRQDPDMLAHLLLGALTEAAMVIARSEDPAAAYKSASHAVRAIVESWRNDRPSS